ncbi:hypothetical protein SAPIO_CDS4749 [Scedosporium apiospermum]|uniref:Protein kinase domain-containing protein n=1 Tax=Pseudallescheria apiosperma TaxID=563466 RepID=A0A084G7J3_PSEDA|nr:uncharacterized protein SAPIO_CDS4749 [Scedosporium apiospermum]KEZ43305.1 hypothetical protein SAPIO_CDS4749 [Scedosporium apiospermum]
MPSDELKVLHVAQYDDFYCTASYVYKGREFCILLCDDPPRPGYDEQNDIVTDYLEKIDDVSAHDGTNEEDNIRQDEYLRQAAEEIGEIVLPLLRELAPSLPVVEVPPTEADHSLYGTLEELLYPSIPECVKLQLVALNGRLTLADDHYGADIPTKGKPMTREEMEDIGPELEDSKHTVAELHKNDIIWGDAKPENVLIDEDDNAWVIDFGGGFTSPWVEYENRQSREGDLLALARIREKLLSSP